MASNPAPKPLARKRETAAAMRRALDRLADHVRRPESAHTAAAPIERGDVVLVVEDDRSTAQVIQEVLEEIGLRTFHVGSAAAAKGELASLDPGLIVLDLRLPDEDGLILCSELRDRTSAPILVCSATERRSEIVLALKLGADDFLSKPFDIWELQARVEALMRRARGSSSSMVTADVLGRRPA